MKTINPKIIRDQINKCYVNYDPEWTTTGEIRIGGFKYHIENTAGLKLDVTPSKDRQGRLGYEINQIEIVNEPKFTMWMLKWS